MKGRNETVQSLLNSSNETVQSLLNRRGQVTIFIIVAIVVVGAIVLGTLFFPDLQGFVSGDVNPNAFLRDCVEPQIKEDMALLNKQGGYLNPEGFAVYQGDRIKYLCHNSQYYQTCVVQQPMLKSHYQNELQKTVEGKLNSCVNELRQQYEKRGYDVSAGRGTSEVSIVPHRVEVRFNTPMTVTKESTQTYKGFDIIIGSEIYDLLLTATSIIEFESTYGDSETTLYLQYYPNLKIDKTKLSEGTTIYKLSNVVTDESFQFASRSLAWPPGYGFQQLRG